MPHGPGPSRTPSPSRGGADAPGRPAGRSGRSAATGRDQAGRTSATGSRQSRGPRGNAASRRNQPSRDTESTTQPGRRRQQNAGTGRSGPSALDLALAEAAASPAPATATFAGLGLDGRLVAALAERDITEPFAIQARVLPDALAGRNVLGKAQTGSGKTLAFGLPLLNRLAGRAAAAGRQPKTPLGLILVPTRELARQVADVLAQLGRGIGVDVTTVYGGVPIGRQIDRVRYADVIVATPGRLLDLLERKACTLGGVEISVLDEADHMADLGFLPAVTTIMDQVPPAGQCMFFSATLDRDVARLVTAYAGDPAVHAVPAPAGATPAEHSMLILSQHDKVQVAAEIAGRPGRTLFFVRTKHGADRLAKQLTRAGTDTAVIHGDRNQNQRQRALDGFAAGHPRVLVATDVAARGIHIDDVDLVVQFDPPADHKDYLHRSGRTARAGAQGQVVALVDHDQVRDLQKLHREAGIAAGRHDVAAGHPLVRRLAASGTPVPPPPPARPTKNASSPRTADPGKARPRRNRARAARQAQSPRRPRPRVARVHDCGSLWRRPGPRPGNLLSSAARPEQQRACALPGRVPRGLRCTVFSWPGCR